MTANPTAPENETAGQMLQRLGMDGKLWAQEFRKTAIELGYPEMDEGWLIGWFANAIMAGYDESQRRIPQPTAPDSREVDEITEIIFEGIKRGDAAHQKWLRDNLKPCVELALHSTRPQPKVAAALRDALESLGRFKQAGEDYVSLNAVLRTLDTILAGEAAPEAVMGDDPNRKAERLPDACPGVSPTSPATREAEADVERAAVAEALYLSFYPSGKFDLQKHKAWLNHAKAAIAAMGQPPKGEPHA